MPDENYLDQNFNPAGSYQNRGPNNRHRARTANTSAVTVQKTRWKVESLFGKENALQLMGCRYEMAQQYFSACHIPGFENQPNIFIWLCVGDILIRNYTPNFHHTYATVDTYMQHGDDLRNRIVMENPLSEFSNVTWSRPNIFQKPTQADLRQGRIRRVNLMNPFETGVVGINPNELTSMTLGSFQPRLCNSYVTKLRKIEVNQLQHINMQIRHQQLVQLPQVEAYVWNELHGPQGPPGWNNGLFWPWENVRMLLTFIPARMKRDKLRSVILMYRSSNLPLPMFNNMGFRTPGMSRLKCWACGPTAGDACPVGERLAGCCSHCSTAWYMAAVLPGNPQQFLSRHRDCNLLDRVNPQQVNMDVMSQVLS